MTTDDRTGAGGRLRPARHTDLTVIAIVAYRNADDVVDCLRHLRASQHQDFVVHICENGGAAAYDALLAALADTLVGLDAPVEGAPRTDRVVRWRAGQLGEGGPRVRLFHSRDNGGYAGGVNLCIEEIPLDLDWDAVWVLNPDTQPAPGALKALVEHAAGGAYGIVGSRLVLKATNRIQLYGGRWRPWLARGFNIGLHAPADIQPDVAAIEGEMSYVNGASMYVTRDFIETVGLMDERYFLYNEEVDWCFRRGAFALGYAHGSVVYHAHGSTIGSNVNRRQRSRLSVYLDERNKLLFTQRFFPGRYPLIALMTLGLTAQYLRQGAVRNFLVALDGWLAGVRGLEGPPAWLK